MKRSHILFCLLAMGLFSSCDSFLDNVQPADDLPVTQVYQTASDLGTALNGVYNTLQSDNWAGANLLLIPIMMSGNSQLFDGPINPDFQNLLDLNLSASNFYTEGLWIEAYKAINQVNLILQALPEVEDAALTPEKEARIRGEALFLRGYLYYELVRYFGQPYGDTSPDGGVPFVSSGVLQKGDLTFPSRESVEEVYNQAETDLSEAKNLLPESEDYGRADFWAAQALLARLAFQKEDYETAAGLAKELIEESGHQLAPAPQEVFTGFSNSEMIWAVRYTPADPSSSKSSYFGENRGLVGLSGDLVASFEAIVTPTQQMALESAGLTVRDWRSTSGVLVNPDTTFSRKYEDIAGYADDTPIARLSEFYLLRAEALALANDLEGAIELLNAIRARSLRVLDSEGQEVPDMQHLVLFSVADFPGGKDELIEAIILERRVELCFEGHYFQDMIRLKRDVQGIPYSDCRLRLPIPQRERDANPNLTQHECYE